MTKLMVIFNQEKTHSTLTARSIKEKAEKKEETKTRSVAAD